MFQQFSVDDYIKLGDLFNGWSDGKYYGLMTIAVDFIRANIKDIENDVSDEKMKHGFT